jgi:hypothetical protein
MIVLVVVHTGQRFSGEDASILTSNPFPPTHLPPASRPAASVRETCFRICLDASLLSKITFLAILKGEIYALIHLLVTNRLTSCLSFFASIVSSRNG